MFVAVAKRSPETVAPMMDAFVNHPVFWVRMYSVQAVMAAKDAARLEKLASDKDDNVVEAALPGLLVLRTPHAMDLIVAAMGRMDVQLLRSAALLVKDQAGEARVKDALLAAIRRLTTERKETSRDARVALLDAYATAAGADGAGALAFLLKDFDPFIAQKAGAIVQQLTGQPARVEPNPPPRGWPQQFNDLRNQCVSVALSNAKSFGLKMAPGYAPLAADRFLKLALVDHYYDGLTFHRLVPNFVIQGGSPGANEYSGHQFFMRDEIAGRNSRGTVGLSTRGRNTADAQIYINLVDNARLDQDYTVFASVFAADLPVVDAIEEGDVMTKITPTRCPQK